MHDRSVAHHGLIGDTVRLMQGFPHLHIALWRIAAEQPALADGLRRMLEVVAGGLPVAVLMVRRSGGGEPGGGGCGAAAMLASAILPDAAPADIEQAGLDRLEEPVPQPGDALGVTLIAIAPAGVKFNAHDRALFLALIEPLAMLLANDQRRRELDVLREKAETERRTLLSGVGKDRLKDEIIGVGGGLRLVMERVELVARSDVPVLLLGETGSGKEVIARAVHTRSTRSGGSFLRVNCGAISPELIDSELFGHEKGSFTGATSGRAGWFERADGGTLLLDEVGELTQAAQVRLLRILQDGTYQRVGGEKMQRADVRIIAATNRDLHAMVASGGFREDLWYRLATFPIRLPPLRERNMDIAELAAHFIDRATQRFGFSRLSPTASDLALLTAYNWPGNVRELGAVIDRAVILGEGRRLEVGKALGTTMSFATSPGGSADAGLQAESGAAGASLVETLAIEPLEVVMRRHIETALRKTLGRVEGPFGAARLLGINADTLRSRMRKLEISRRAFERK